MEQSRFKEIVSEIYTDFAQRRLLDNYLSVDLFSNISENCTLDMFCTKCRYLSKINIMTYDDHVMAHCETCEWDYHNLEFELKPLLYLNVQRAKEQRVMTMKEDCC